MRDCLNNRGGFDRVLMAVAATFLTMSATSALAQTPSRSTRQNWRSMLPIPRPEPANVPPPTAADFKMDTTASTTPAAPPDSPPISTTAPAPVTTDNAALAPAVPLPAAACRTDCLRTRPHPAAPATAAVARARPQPPAAPGCRAHEGAATCRRPISRSPTGSRTCLQPRTCVISTARPSAHGREILRRARLRAAVDAGRQPHRQRQGRDRAPEGRRLRRPQCRATIRCRISPSPPRRTRSPKPI